MTDHSTALVMLLSKSGWLPQMELPSLWWQCVLDTNYMKQRYRSHCWPAHQPHTSCKLVVAILRQRKIFTQSAWRHIISISERTEVINLFLLYFSRPCSCLKTSDLMLRQYTCPSLDYAEVWPFQGSMSQLAMLQSIELMWHNTVLTGLFGHRDPRK